MYRIPNGLNIHEAAANSTRIGLKEPIEVLFQIMSKTWNSESIVHENAEKGCMRTIDQGAGGDLCDGGMAGVMTRFTTR